MNAERTYAEVQEARLGLAQELAIQRVHIIRIGKSALDGANVCLRVYLPVDTSPDDRDKVPAEFDGFPVKVVNNGPILPQESE